MVTMTIMVMMYDGHGHDHDHHDEVTFRSLFPKHLARGYNRTKTNADENK